jgi:hypothetical protein
MASLVCHSIEISFLYLYHFRSWIVGWLWRPPPPERLTSPYDVMSDRSDASLWYRSSLPFGFTGSNTIRCVTELQLCEGGRQSSGCRDAKHAASHSTVLHLPVSLRETYIQWVCANIILPIVLQTWNRVLWLVMPSFWPWLQTWYRVYPRFNGLRGGRVSGIVCIKLKVR